MTGPQPAKEPMIGGPQDGDEFLEDPALEQEPREPEPPTSTVHADPLADMRARMDRLERENDALRRQIPPATPKKDQPPEEPDIDWDKELFANPKEALKKYGDHIKKSVTQELRSEYQKDRGTRDFWDKFYSMFPDLRQDHDLVEVTLNSQLSVLANMPVESAYTKLAELTRDRILRYAGGAARARGKKARAEGAGALETPRSPASKTEPEKVTTLSDFIRNRKSNRRKSQLGAV